MEPIKPADNQVQLNEIEADMRAMAVEADKAGQTDVPFTPRVGNAAQPKAADPVKPDDTKTGQENTPAAKPADAKAGTELTEEQKIEAEKKAAAEKAKRESGKDESKFAKAKKEGERLDKSWKALNEEKEKARKEQEELHSFLDELEKEIDEIPDSPEPAPRWTAEELEAAAKDFEADGKADVAAQARAEAKRVKEIEAQKAESVSSKQTKKFQAEWESNLALQKKENPELEDQGSPLGQAVVGLLQSKPVLSMYPDGIRDAVAIAKLQIAANSVPALQTRLKELEEQNKQLQEKIQIHGGQPSQRAKPKTFDEMTSEEQEAALRANAVEMDQTVMAGG